MSKVYIFFADGFEDIEGLTVVDLMRRAGIDIQTVSIKETKEIKTSHGIHLLTDRTFGECDFSDADMLVIPGGMPGTKYLEEYKPLTDLLTGFQEWESFQRFVKERKDSFPPSTGIVMCDINGLSVINSTMGTQSGDQKIRHLAESMRKCFPKQTYYVRGTEAALIALCSHSSEEEMRSLSAEV